MTLIICADDDAGTAGNPGLTKATEAAQAVNGLLAVPDFGADRPDGATDFNDLATAQGPEAVRHCIEAAATVTALKLRMAGAEAHHRGAASCPCLRPGGAFT